MEITRTIIAVCLGLVVASQAQECSKPVPGPNMNLKDSDIVLTTFPDGHKATFVCSLGYTPAGGSGAVTCTAGSWTKVTLHCKKKTCGSPGQVDNGEIEYPSGNEFGDKIVVKCNPGFRLVGKPELTCGDQGWLGRLPVCEVVTCDPPAGIPNGLFSPVKDVYNYREVVQYNCTGDLILNGSKSVTCSEDGTFTPGPPQCTEVECSHPKVANGDWVSGSVPPHKHLATVTYSCNAGYKMEGDATIECGRNGQWTPGIPKCTEKTCGSAGQVDNGKIDYPSGNKFGDKLVVTCNLGFRLVGKPELTCGDQGWLGRLPECEEVECADPKVANGEWVSGSRPPHKYLATVTYSCNAGYKMEGNATMECGRNGQWMPVIPKCKAVTCSPPPTITSGTFSPQKSLYQYQEMVEYSCDQGFTLSGSKSLSCSLDGTFKGSPPTCSKKTCGSAGQVDNGEIEYLPGKEFGDKLVVKCNLGFRLVGKRELTCGDQGWLGRLPECEVVTCDPPADIPNGLFSPVKDVYNYQEVVQYNCTGDLILNGSNSVTCSEDGTFTPGPPQCTEVECADPKVANGEWVSGSRPPHKHLATVTYRCNAGYEMEGNATIECYLDGQWRPGIPKCTGPSSPTVGLTVGILAAVMGVGIVSGIGFLVYRNKPQSSWKDLHGKQGTETEEEVALS